MFASDKRIIKLFNLLLVSIAATVNWSKKGLIWVQIYLKRHSRHFLPSNQDLVNTTFRAAGAASPLNLAVRRGRPNGEPKLAATPGEPRRSSSLGFSSWPRRAKLLTKSLLQRWICRNINGYITVWVCRNYKRLCLFVCFSPFTFLHKLYKYQLIFTSPHYISTN